MYNIREIPESLNVHLPTKWKAGGDVISYVETLFIIEILFI